MTTYKISDSNSDDAGLSYSEAVERIAEWYEDVDQWSDGVGDDATREAVREAIAAVEQPSDDGDLSDLQRYASEIDDAVARVMGNEAFHGHGNYSVSAASQGGFSLTVIAEEPEEEIRFDAAGEVSMVWCDGKPLRCPTQHDMDTLPVGEDMADEEVASLDA